MNVNSDENDKIMPDRQLRYIRDRVAVLCDIVKARRKRRAFKCLIILFVGGRRFEFIFRPASERIRCGDYDDEFHKEESLRYNDQYRKRHIYFGNVFDRYQCKTYTAVEERKA